VGGGKKKKRNDDEGKGGAEERTASAGKGKPGKGRLRRESTPATFKERPFPKKKITSAEQIVEKDSRPRGKRTFEKKRWPNQKGSLEKKTMLQKGEANGKKDA